MWRVGTAEELAPAPARRSSKVSHLPAGWPVAYRLGAALLQRAGTRSSLSLCPLQGQGQPLPSLHPWWVRAAALGAGAILGGKIAVFCKIWK